METLMQDIRYGARMLLRNPGFMIVAVITLALGIGANTAIFSMVDGILLRPLPVKDPAEITVVAYQQHKGSIQTQFSVAAYRDIRSQSSEVFSDVFAYQISLDGLSVDGKADRIMTNYVSGNFFSALGIKPELGRFILPSEGETLGADPVMVLSYSYWQTRFGRDPAVIGRKVSMDGRPITIVGVAPRGFVGISPFVSIQGFLPLGMLEIAGAPNDFMTDRHLRNLPVLGRLRPGTNLQQARASVSVLGQRLSQQYPEAEKDLSLQVYPELRSRPQPDPDNTLLVMSGLFLGLTAMVLLLACVNVANILLVRATVREREMAIRAALGAARIRLVRQLLTESILLALLGGIAGIFLGHWGSAVLASINVQTDLPVHLDFGFDWRIFSYATAAALLTGIIVGLVPAIRASRGNLAAILHEGGRGVVGGKNRLRTGLVVAQVAGSLVLLIIAGLFVRSMGKAERTTLGFDPDQVVNFAMDPVEIGFNQQQTRDFYKNVLSRVSSLPGVVSASIATATPMGYYNNYNTLTINGYQPTPGQPLPSALYNTISPDYFRTMQVPILRGRAFTDADGETTQYVAILSDSTAKKFWPNADPIGRQFQMGSDAKHSMVVVGVVKDVRYQGVTGEVPPVFYAPFVQHQSANSLQFLQVRTTAAPETMIPEVERTIQSLAPQLPVFDVQTMRQGLYTLNGLLIYRLGAALAAVLGVLGLILAIVGVYGVVSYAASQKTHEIGVRMALGAQPMDILKMVLREGLFIVAIGLAVGIAMTLAAAQVVGKFLTVSALDPVTYVVVSATLTIVALAACYIPARRAMRVDPMVALRYE
ncbi:MAG TPA: ABC transporter permease [Candidatus Acidoferrales bacterium]|nr:ABC transporter permease [Candidatus Acidoferrales bacterium]